MPAALERELWAEVRKLHPNWSDERKRAYVYGTLRKTGWTPSTQRKHKKKSKDWDKYRKKKISRRRKGNPRTDTERRARHKSLYGTTKLPPRGTGL